MNANIYVYSSAGFETAIAAMQSVDTLPRINRAAALDAARGEYFQPRKTALGTWQIVIVSPLTDGGS